MKELLEKLGIACNVLSIPISKIVRDMNSGNNSNYLYYHLLTLNFLKSYM